MLANLYQIDRGSSTIRVQNFYSEHLEPMDIQLEPMLSASDNAQKYFQKYNKAKNAVNYILEQIELTEVEISYFETLLIQIETASLKDAYEIKEELENAGYLRKRQTKKRKSNGKPSIEKYLSSDDVEIYVGKNNLQNDYLTHKLARRHEWWFHAKDMPGSHVLVRSDADELSETTIRTAAQLAAYFSKGRLSSSVPIDYTRVRHVKKIPAAHLGLVTYENQKTIYIDPDEAFIMNLKKLK
ncbi:MAG: NFACT family protein [Turicibacter sanguinis]